MDAFLPQSLSMCLLLTHFWTTNPVILLHSLDACFQLAIDVQHTCLITPANYPHIQYILVYLLWWGARLLCAMLSARVLLVCLTWILDLLSVGLFSFFSLLILHLLLVGLISELLLFGLYSVFLGCPFVFQDPWVHALSDNSAPEVSLTCDSR